MDINWRVLNDECKDALGIITDNIIEASNDGNIKLNNYLINGSKASKGKYGFYKTFKVGKTLYFHRIIYLAFNPEDAIKVKNGARIIIKDDPSIVINNYYRNYPEDMIIDPFATQKPILNTNYIEVDIIHNDYGIIKSGISYPLHYKDENNNIIKTDNYDIKFYDDINHPFDIINTTNNNLLRNFRSMITFSHNGTQKKTLTHVLLCTAFPQITPNETVDHINDEPNDNRVSNLRWLSWSDNAKKGQKKSVESKLAKGGANGRKVIMCDLEMKQLKEFINIRVAAEFLINNDSNINGQVKTVESKIRRAIKDKIKAYGYYWIEPNEEKIEDEIWKKLPAWYNPIENNNKTYMVSTHGRIRSTQGGIMSVVKDRNGAKYTSVYLRSTVNSKRHYIHYLVWETFNGKVPEEFEVLHNDYAPLLENGSYRNWLIDLSLGKRKENMKEYYKAKHSKTENNN